MTLDDKIRHAIKLLQSIPQDGPIELSYSGGKDSDVILELTKMSRNGIKYGDRVLIEGAGQYDGEWTVDDTMHSKWAGQDRIDFLVPEHIRLGKWENVKVYKR